MLTRAATSRLGVQATRSGHVAPRVSNVDVTAALHDQRADAAGNGEAAAENGEDAAGEDAGERSAVARPETGRMWPKRSITIHSTKPVDFTTFFNGCVDSARQIHKERNYNFEIPVPFEACSVWPEGQMARITDNNSNRVAVLTFTFGSKLTPDLRFRADDLRAARIADGILHLVVAFWGPCVPRTRLDVQLLVENVPYAHGEFMIISKLTTMSKRRGILRDFHDTSDTSDASETSDARCSRSPLKCGTRHRSRRLGHVRARTPPLPSRCSPRTFRTRPRRYDTDGTGSNAMRSVSSSDEDDSASCTDVTSTVMQSPLPSDTTREDLHHFLAQHLFPESLRTSDDSSDLARTRPASQASGLAGSPSHHQLSSFTSMASSATPTAAAAVATLAGAVAIPATAERTLAVASRGPHLLLSPLVDLTTLPSSVAGLPTWTYGVLVPANLSSDIGTQDISDFIITLQDVIQ